MLCIFPENYASWKKQRILMVFFVLGTCAVADICHAVVIVVKVIALHFVSALRLAADSVFSLDVTCLNFRSLLLTIYHWNFLLPIFSHFINSLQVCLCFSNSVASTRFMLQDEFSIQTTKCDNCIIVLLFFSHKHTNTLYLCIYIYICRIYCL